MARLWLSYFLLNIIACVKTEIQKVSLDIIFLPIVFGDNAHLFCNLSLVSDCCSNTVTWMSNLDVIVHYGVSTNLSKFVQIEKQEGYILQIKHFGETDLNIKYSCLYEFYTASKTLVINTDQYQKHPTNDDYAIQELMKDDHTALNLSFQNVYPIPKCRILANDFESRAKPSKKPQHNGMYYTVSFRIILNNTEDNCKKNMSLVCSVGRYNITRSLEQKLMCSKSDIDDLHKTLRYAAVVSISTLVTIMCALVTLLYIKKRRKSPSSKGDDNEERNRLLQANCDGVEYNVQDETLSSLKPRLTKVHNYQNVFNESNLTTELAKSNKMVWKKREDYYEQGNYDVYFGYCLCPPENAPARDRFSNIPVQREKHMKQCFWYYFWEYANGIEQFFSATRYSLVVTALATVTCHTATPVNIERNEG